MSKETNPLAAFTLGVPGESTETKKVDTKKVDKPTKVKKTKEDPKEDEESEFSDEFKSKGSFFTDRKTITPGDPIESGDEDEESEEQDEDELEESEEEVEDTNPSSIKAIIDHYTGKGILEKPENFDSEFKDSDEDIDKVVNHTINSKLSKELSRKREALPQTMRDMLDFVENGGDPKQFAEMYFLEHSYEDISSELIEKDVEAQKFIVGSYLKALDPTNTDEDIENELNELEDMGALEARAKKYHPKLIEREKAQKAELIEKQKLEKENRIKANKQYWENIKKELDSKKDLKGFNIDNKNLKEGLYEYMTKPVKNGKSQMQIDNEEADKTEDQLLWAYLKYTKYDIDKLSKSIKTKVTKELKSKLNNWSEKGNKTTKPNLGNESEYGDLKAFILKTEK